MGIDFSHGGAHWSYSGFNMFRSELAQHEGFDLDTMEGFAKDHGYPWDTVTTPLKPLLNHSDCDGHLTPEECREVAPRLRAVIDELWPPIPGDPYDDGGRLRGLALAEGMEMAAEAGENFEFE